MYQEFNSSDSNQSSQIKIRDFVKRNRFQIGLTISFSIISFVLLIYQSQTINSDEGHFWIFTDSHVDLSYREDGDPTSFCRISLKDNTQRKYGHPDCGSPTVLLSSALSAARRIDSKIDFIIWLGDAASHRQFDNGSILEINGDLTAQLVKYFPKKLIIPVLGNHDIILRNNHTDRFKDFYMTTNYSLLLKDVEARRTFVQGGYYSLRYKPPKGNSRSYLRFVVLNTAVYQAVYSSYFNVDILNDQIDWFNRTMMDATARKDRVLLLVHTPFGINENLLYKFLVLEYEQKLLSIISHHSSTIILCLSAHRHQDAFSFYSNKNGPMAIISQPAISPIGLLSRPSIRKFSYDRNSLDILDYDQYSLSLDEAHQTQNDLWRFAYRFSTWYYQSKGLTRDSLRYLIYLIRTQRSYLKRYLIAKYYPRQQILKKNQIIQALCALTKFDFDEFLICSKRLNEQNLEVHRDINLNYSRITNPHVQEQSTEYKRTYRFVAISLVVFLIVCSIGVYPMFRKCFCWHTENE